MPAPAPQLALYEPLEAVGHPVQGETGDFEPKCEADFRRESGRVSTPRPEPSDESLQDLIRLRLRRGHAATNGSPGGKLPAGNFAVRSPHRSFSEAVRNATTNHPYIS
jgi:hypothetical protein